MLDIAGTLLEVAIHCRDRFGVDMPIGLFDVQGKVEDRVRRLLDRRRNAGVRLPARARWGILAAASIFLAVAASFPLVAPAQAEIQHVGEQASSNSDKSGALVASEKLNGGLMGRNHKPVAAAEQRAPAQDSRELIEARQRAVAFLVKQQDDGKISEIGGLKGGVPALVTLALLQSGVKPDDSRLAKLLAKVRGLEPGLTYVTALQTLVLCVAEPKKDIEVIGRNVKWLEETQVHSKDRPGAWSYGTKTPPEVTNTLKGDNSNTQFAMLALHEADLAGAAAGETTWRLALDHWLTTQRDDGSWGYMPQMQGIGSMTCAGVACISARRNGSKTKPRSKPRRRL